MSEKSEDLSCEDTKNYMKLFYNLGFFWVQIIFLIIMYIFTYSLSRWFFWTRSWGSWKNKPGEIWGVAQFFIFIMFMGVIFGLISPILTVINTIKKFIPGPTGILQVIFRICIKIMQISTVIFPIFGTLSILKRFILYVVSGFRKKGVICPIPQQDYFTYVSNKVTKIKEDEAKLEAALAENNQQYKAPTDDQRIKSLYNIIRWGGYIYLENMDDLENGNNKFTQNLFNALELNVDDKIRLLDKFNSGISKFVNPFTFYVSDPNGDIWNSRENRVNLNRERKEKQEADKALEGVGNLFQGGSRGKVPDIWSKGKKKLKVDEKDKSAKMAWESTLEQKNKEAPRWMSNDSSEQKISQVLGYAFNGKNNHIFSCCGITIHSLTPPYPGWNLIPGFSRSNLYGASFVKDKEKNAYIAGMAGGCSPCNLFGTFLNFCLFADAKLLQILMTLCGLFLLLSFIFWLKWWFGCWGWAEAEDNKDQEQQDRKENNIPLKKIDLMRNESNIEYKNGTSELKSYAKWVKEWEIQAEKEEENLKVKFLNEPFPPTEKDQKNEIALVKDNRLVELFNSDGPEAPDSFSDNNEPARIEWKKFTKGKAQGQFFMSNFTSIFNTF